MADVTKMLEKDHREVARLFREIKKTNGAARRKLVDQLTADLRRPKRSIVRSVLIAIGTVTSSVVGVASTRLASELAV